MYTKKIFVVFGHDKRQATIARALIEKGHTVRLCCAGMITDLVIGCEVFLEWKQAMEDCDVVILPLPITRDGSTLAYTDETVYLEDIIKSAKKCGCRHIIGGLIPESILSQNIGGIYFDDYYKSDKLQQKNALPSAEGALMLAMENTDKIINGLNVLISGYGKIGHCLADILHKLGAYVTVAARRDESLCEASLSGYKTIRINKNGIAPESITENFDVIFNTVPSTVYMKNTFSAIKGNTVYIEIASAPYGLDLVSARNAGVEVIFAPSIPGKYAPTSAGMYIFETISEILSKRGISI